MQRVASAMTKSANRIFDFSKHGKCKIALRVAYAGWDLHGFAWQKDASTTVEQALFDALEKTRCVVDLFAFRRCRVILRASLSCLLLL
jgi:hypothetical protein